MSKVSTAKHAAPRKTGGPKHAKHAAPARRRFDVRYAMGGAFAALIIAICVVAVPSFGAGRDVSSAEAPETAAAALDASIGAAEAVRAATPTTAAEEGVSPSGAQAPASADEGAPDAPAAATSGEMTGDAPDATPSDAVEASSQSEMPTASASESFSAQAPQAPVAEPSEAETAEASSSGGVADAGESADAPGQDPSVADASGGSAAADAENASTDTGASALVVNSMNEAAVAVADEQDIAFYQGLSKDGNSMDDVEAAWLSLAGASYADEVGPMLQEGLLDSGCEVVSLAIVLKSMGVDADPLVIADGYLDYEGGMAEGYVGNPYEGGGGFPAGIAKAANAYLSDLGSDYRAYDLTGSPFDTLVGLVERGYPVMVWTTIDFDEPYLWGLYEGDYEWYGNEHCVVLYGIDGENVLVSDPLEGLVERDAEQFAAIYEQCGSMSLYIR